MAKLSRIFQKRFASLAGANEIGVFGSLAAGTPATTTSPDTAQSLANFDEGWLAAVLAENAPAIEDMNALFFIAFYQMAYLFENGIPEWDDETTYYIGALVLSGSTLYQSLTDTNLNNAVTDTTNWKIFQSGIKTYSASGTLNGSYDVHEFNCTSALCVATLPSAATYKGRRMTVVKSDATTNPVTFANVANDSQLNLQYDSVTYFSNGTVWYQV